MLNPFPDLLVYSILVPTLLRLTAAFAFGYLGYLHYHDRAILGARLGSNGQKIIWAITAVYWLITAGFVLGYYTQLAALTGAFVILLHLVLRKTFPMHSDTPSSTYYFLLVICASLMLTGAGAFAFDIPL